MRRTRMLMLGCSAAACAVLVVVSTVAGRGGGGGRGGGHVGSHGGSGTMSGFHPGAIHSDNRMMSHPGSHPGSWQSQQFRHMESFNQPRLTERLDQPRLTERLHQPQPIENFNRFNAWGDRYAARWPSYNSWYHGNWYDHGHRWWNDGLAGWWWGDGAYDWGNGGDGAPWRWGYYPYDNPYCDLDSGTTVYDYSQPLILASPPADSAATELSDSEQDGIRLLDAAKDSFRQGDYSLSDKVLILKQGDKAMMVGQVKSLPGGGFNFKVVGDNPSDLGVNFLK